MIEEEVRVSAFFFSTLELSITTACLLFLSFNRSFKHDYHATGGISPSRSHRHQDRHQIKRYNGSGDCTERRADILNRQDISHRHLMST